jgi:hypothetical protein
MVPADELVAFNLPFAQQRALMRAVALECAPSRPSPGERDVNPVGGDGERTAPGKFAQKGDANESFMFHQTAPV